jgi:hypothetical protein
MAYGVKYRLDFEDHEGSGRRLDILKNNYTGDILPLVGGAEPVKIKWDGDDDFYSPIIGSTCSINLYQTDETNYDDFFNEPEREYKVEVYVAQAIRDEFKNKVQLDGGIVEAADCINGSYYDTGTFLQNRVINDGGIMEALDCVSAVLTETQDNYTLFWTGWLLSDQFKELMMPNPQAIQLTAIDGLGDLDNLFVDNTFYSINTGLQRIQASLASVICAAINKTGLGLDVIINNELSVFDILGNRSEFLTYVNTFINESVFLSDEYEFFNAKEFLENVLKSVNSRVFQANGKFVVVNNSLYSEQAVIDYVKDYIDDNDAVPSGIGALRQAYLKGDIEQLYYKRFNSSGTLQGDYYYEGLRTIRTDLQPLDQNLTREAERGYKALLYKTELVKANLSYKEDAGFEFQNTNHWTISSGSFVTDEIAFSGVRSFKTTATNSGATPTNLAITGNYLYPRDFDLKLKLSYYYSATGLQTSTGYNKFWCQLYFTNGPTYYYDSANNNWTTTAKYFFFEDAAISSANKWISQDISIAKLPAAAGQSQTVILKIYGPEIFLLNYQGVYVDNTLLYLDSPSTEANEITLTQDTTTNVIIGDLEVDRPLNGLVLDYTGVYDVSNILSTSTPVLQTQKQQLDDFRTIVTRYEGTVYNNETAPVTPMDKLRINFTNFSEPDSLILDSLEYSVKSNRYNIIAHKPNQDNPVAATSTSKFTTVVQS